MLYLLGLSISLLLGWLLIEILSSKNTKISFYLKLFLSAGLGLGLSGYLVFFTFLTFNQYNRWAVIAGHVISLTILFALRVKQCKKNKIPFLIIEDWGSTNLLGFILILSLIIPLWIQGFLYPYGGWDAWSCWNLKVQFLFSGGESWRNMFDPLMWRSNTHYPFLLPLINVWNLSFYKDAVNIVPLYNSIAFPVITAGVLFFGLKELTGRFLTIIPVLAIFSLSFFVKLSASQYSDLVLGFYLLAVVVTLVLTQKYSSKSYCSIAGLMLGFLSFTKTEGLVAAFLMLALGCAYLFLNFSKIKDRKIFLKTFILASIISLLPTILFKLFLSPGNEIFVNGLISDEKPSTFIRFNWIFAFLGVELIHAKWHGLWIISALGVLLSLPRSFGGKLWIIPVFIGLYLLIAIIYYYVNTYFDLVWWLSVTLNRILFSILPLVIFWMGASVWRSEEK